MFSSIKTEECMESELFGIFLVKLAAKNITVRCLFLKKHTYVLDQTVRLVTLLDRLDTVRHCWVRFHVFLCFYARKHDIVILPCVDRIC